MGERLTKQDIKRIQDEIDERKLVIRQQALEDLKEARAQGDLSENFEYTAAKRFKNKNESRIRYLERVLKNATLIRDNTADDEAGVDKTVTLYFEEDDEVETYRLVTSMRADVVNSKISVESPLGKALIGHKAGDRVLVQTDLDSYYVVIRSVENTGDDGRDQIRSF